eukprot:XP_011679261.1 PREDICTED: uncharacterized protein LOC763955 [Strongylocentrotus purpuratus]
MTHCMPHGDGRTEQIVYALRLGMVMARCNRFAQKITKAPGKPRELSAGNAGGADFMIEQPPGKQDSLSFARKNPVDIGAGQDVGRSCILLTIGSKNIMLDCGMHMGFNDERRFPDFSYINKNGRLTDHLDAVIISHFHLDHCGALPHMSEIVGYDGPIYMTQPTKAICPILLEDYRKITVEKKGETNFFTSAMIKDCMKKVVVVNLHQIIQVDDELEIKAYYAGHVLGAGMFHIKVGQQSVVYTISDDYYNGELSPQRALVFYLLENGAKIDVRDERGNLPIQYAKDEVVKQMILSRLPSFEEIKSHRDEPPTAAIISVEVKSDTSQEIELEDHGVSMFIPPEAVHRSDRCKIVFSLLRDLPSVDIQDDESVACYGIRCDPPNMIFHQPVKIRIPHSTLTINPDQVKPDIVSHFWDSVNDLPRTSRMISSSSPDEPPYCRVYKRHLELYIGHCAEWWVLIPLVQQVIRHQLMCTPYIPDTIERGTEIEVHLHIHANLPGMDAEVQEAEKKQSYRKVHPSVPISIATKSGDVQVICCRQEEFEQRKANHYYKLFITWTNQKIKKTFVKRNLFEFQHIKVHVYELKYESSLEPASFDRVVEEVSKSDLEDIDVHTIAEKMTVDQFYDLGVALGFRIQQLDVIEYRRFRDRQHATYDMLVTWRQAQPSGQQAKETLLSLMKSLDSPAEEMKMTDEPPTAAIISVEVKSDTSQEIELEDHGVSMFIPPEAVHRSDRCKIVFSLLRDLPSVDIQDDESVACYGIRCDPPNMIFHQPVKIRIPHSTLTINPDQVKPDIVSHFWDSVNERPLNGRLLKEQTPQRTQTGRYRGVHTQIPDLFRKIKPEQFYEIGGKLGLDKTELEHIQHRTLSNRKDANIQMLSKWKASQTSGNEAIQTLKLVWESVKAVRNVENLEDEGSSRELEQTPVEKTKPNEPSCEHEDMEIIVTSDCGKETHNFVVHICEIMKVEVLDKTLLAFSRKIKPEQFSEIGGKLGLSKTELEHIQHRTLSNRKDANIQMLSKWKASQTSGNEAIQTLTLVWESVQAVPNVESLEDEGSSGKLEQTPVEKMKPNEPSCEPEDMEIIMMFSVLLRENMQSLIRTLTGMVEYQTQKSFAASLFQ